MAYQGSRDIDAAVSALAGRLPGPLAPLARVAYNYRWSWLPDGPATFATVDPDRWARLGGNPVRLLTDAPAAVLDWAATDPDLVARGVRLAAAIDDDAGRTPRAGPVTPENPVAFLYAEFGVHASLPIYSGGLGVLAGDILKAASDLALPLVGVGLLYRTGYFHQRIDTTGLQHEYWVDTDPTLLPCVRVTDRDGQPLTATSQCTTRTSLCRCGGSTWGGYRSTCSTPISPRTRSWRWITSRLYEGNRAIRLAQYAVLGVGGARALAAMGIRPTVYHLNEGHPALAALELLTEAIADGAGWKDAWAVTAQRVVFTTHTPVPAGNETYTADEMLRMLGRLLERTGDSDRILAAGRVDPNDLSQPSGMTVFALRASRAANAVSRRHGEVARAMWQPCSRTAPSTTSRSPTSPTACTCRPGCARRCAASLTVTSAISGWHTPTTPAPGRPSTPYPTKSFGKPGAPPVPSSWRCHAAELPGTGYDGAKTSPMSRRSRRASTPAGSRWGSPAGWPLTSASTSWRCALSAPWVCSAANGHCSSCLPARPTPSTTTPNGSCRTYFA